MRRRLRTHPLPFAALVAVLGIATTASADLVSDAEAECSGAAEGKACKVDGAAGTCKPSKCARLDYSGGSPPQTIEYDCMVCEPGGAPTPEAAPQPGEPTPAKADPVAAPAPAADAKAPAAPAPAKSGCSSGGTAGDPWLTGVLAVTLGLVRRRRSHR